MADPLAIADKISQIAADTLDPLERTIDKWPAEFRSIMWHAVADMASRLQAEADAAVSPRG